MRIKQHKFDDFWYRRTSNVTPQKKIEPNYIVLHYTTGWSGETSRDWLLGASGRSRNTKSSAHLVVDRDGTVWQICEFNHRGWHAGPSRFGTVTDLNSHAVGIEFVNPGWLKVHSTHRWVDDFGNVRTKEQLEEFGGCVEARHPRVGGATYLWPHFTESQIKTGVEICRALVSTYPIKGIVTHEEIDTRGWKVDPGPAFPLEPFRVLLEDYGEEEGEQIYRVEATRLNLRGGAGLDFERIDPPGSLPFGTTLRIMRSEGRWSFVEVFQPGPSNAPVAQGVRGWVSRDYLEPAGRI